MALVVFNIMICLVIMTGTFAPRESATHDSEPSLLWLSRSSSFSKCHLSSTPVPQGLPVCLGPEKPPPGCALLSCCLDFMFQFCSQPGVLAAVFPGSRVADSVLLRPYDCPPQ